MNNFVKKTKCLLAMFLIILLASACQSKQEQSFARQNSETIQNEKHVKEDSAVVQITASNENLRVNSGLLIGLVKNKEANKGLEPMESADSGI